MPAVGLTTPTISSARSSSPRSSRARASSPSSAVRSTRTFGTARTRRPATGAAARTSRRRARPVPIALFAANEAGYANLIKLSSRAFLGPEPTEPSHIKIDALEEHGEGLIALTGGPQGPIDTALRDGQMDLARDRLQKLLRTFGDRLYIELQRHGAAIRGGCRAAADRARLRARHSARRHQRGLFRHPRRLRGPRRAALHRRGPHRRRGQSPPRDARALLQDRRRDGRDVRRSSRGARKHDRDRPALRLPPQGPRADPAALRRDEERRRATPTGSPPRRPSSSARPRRGCARALRRNLRRPASPRRTTGSASPSRSRSSPR